jgi:glutaredoxin
MMKLVLYGTDGCHLCEEAEQLLNGVLATSSLSFEVEQTDITLADELMALYGIRIPVLKKVDSGEELGWPFDKASLNHFLFLL